MILQVGRDVRKQGISMEFRLQAERLGHREFRLRDRMEFRLQAELSARRHARDSVYVGSSA